MKGMIQKLKISIVTLSLLLVPVLALSGAANAQTDKVSGSLCQGGGNVALGEEADCEDVTEDSEEGLNNVITNVVNVLSLIVGIIAVIMIVIGGFRYITSGGDSGNVSGAKNTILYAIVGLVIVALAQFIVRFVLSQSTGLDDA
jgi:hypothetical protein